jgi:hypothetical protein
MLVADVFETFINGINELETMGQTRQHRLFRRQLTHTPNAM